MDKYYKYFKFNLYFIFYYSYGVVMWECLTGEIPYKGYYDNIIIFGVGTGTLSLKIFEDCPDSLQDLLKGIHKDLLILTINLVYCGF